MTYDRKHNDAWAAFTAHDPMRYKEVRLDKLATVGMYMLSKSGLECTFDNIVVALHKLFPEKFSLLSFPEYPDSIRVDNTLRLDCKHSRYSLGNRIKGFTLTELGTIAAQETMKELQGEHHEDRGELRRAHSEFRNRATRLTTEVGKSDAYRKFKSGELVTRFDVCDVLHGSLDTDDKLLRSNLEKLQSYANSLVPIREYQDLADSVLEFLGFVKTNWERIMSGK
jgi:hypothetical protein